MLFFSDEYVALVCRMIPKHFVCGEPVQRQNNPMYFQPTFKNSVSVMFWRCIGPNGVGRLVICRDKMDASSYIAILQNFIFFIYFFYFKIFYPGYKFSLITGLQSALKN